MECRPDLRPNRATPGRNRPKLAGPRENLAETGPLRKLAAIPTHVGQHIGSISTGFWPNSTDFDQSSPEADLIRPNSAWSLPMARPMLPSLRGPSVLRPSPHEDVYAGSRFVELSAEGRGAAALRADFGEHNAQRVQIFRLLWPPRAAPL